MTDVRICSWYGVLAPLVESAERILFSASRPISGRCSSFEKLCQLYSREAPQVIASSSLHEGDGAGLGLGGG